MGHRLDVTKELRIEQEVIGGIRSRAGVMRTHLIGQEEVTPGQTRAVVTSSLPPRLQIGAQLFPHGSIDNDAVGQDDHPVSRKIARRIKNLELDLELLKDIQRAQIPQR